MFDKPLTNGEIYYVLCEDNVSARPIRVIDTLKDWGVDPEAGFCRIPVIKVIISGKVLFKKII
ncbi:MAG: hypothetical protein GX031_03685 [Candidatus Riflebacteria bacterium]|nr:hypothetical protein [Candidatus Riflebacteria bacterium]